MIDSRFLRPITRRIQHMLARAVVRLVNDAAGIQELQISLLHNEVRDKVERFQEYGFTSHPHEGASALAVFMGGNRDHGVVLAVEDRRYRVRSMQQGEVCIYTDEGDEIRMKRGNHIQITAGTKVTIDALDTTLTGNLEVLGSVSVVGDVVSARDTTAVSLTTHIHNGVSSGSATTTSPL